MTTNSDSSSAETSFGTIDLKAETHVLAPGRYTATVSEVRLVKNREGNTLWLFVALDVHDADGVVMGQVEDKFLTIAAREGSQYLGRVREGLKKLALYGAAAGVDLNDTEPEDIAGKLIGHRIVAVIGRYGAGVRAENRIAGIMRDAE